MAITLLDFQQAATTALVEAAVGYFAAGQDRFSGRPVPFVGQLKAVTGAGKTPILASVIRQFKPGIVLWTTKFGSVVDQTVTNLKGGGKYHHLLGDKSVEVVKFSDIRSPEEWHRILENKHGLTILVSTVAAWNSAEKDVRLNVHAVKQDWGEKSRWNQLKADRSRPLWIVYDEAHNTTTEQIELLDDLDPAGFLVASASPVGGKLQFYLTALTEEQRKQRIIPVRTRDVVDCQLLKSTISLADYQSSTEEMLSDVVKRRKELQDQLVVSGINVVPKAIYVVETSGVGKKGDEPRPVTIWKNLVNMCGVPPSEIAICTNTKDLPRDAIRVNNIEQLSSNLTHIIFNKKLQEGWDDPSVYCCYFDGRTESATRIQQVIGRALRQPTATHFANEDLNTAYFFINCPNETLEQITDDLKKELRIYKGDGDPEDFEPFKIREERKTPPKIALKEEWVGKLRVPRMQAELSGTGDRLRSVVEKKTIGFAADDLAAPGKAIINIVSVKTGDTEQKSRDLLEDMRVRCGAYLQEQIRSQSRNCVNAMHPGIFTGPKLDALACFHSKALEHYRGVANDVVREYENRVSLDVLADDDEANFVVQAFQPAGETFKSYDHAGHPKYDTKSFNNPETEFAKAIDKFASHVWVRNMDRVGYGITMPVKSGSSSTFYPDFLWWVKSTVWAIDPTGQHILEAKIRTKLLTVPPPLKIALLTQGKLDGNYHPYDADGWSLLRFRFGNVLPEVFDTLAELLSVLEAES